MSRRAWISTAVASAVMWSCIGALVALLTGASASRVATTLVQLVLVGAVVISLTAIIRDAYRDRAERAQVRAGLAHIDEHRTYARAMAGTPVGAVRGGRR